VGCLRPSYIDLISENGLWDRVTKPVWFKVKGLGLGFKDKLHNPATKLASLP